METMQKGGMVKKIKNKIIKKKRLDGRKKKRTGPTQKRQSSGDTSTFLSL